MTRWGLFVLFRENVPATVLFTQPSQCTCSIWLGLVELFMELESGKPTQLVTHGGL